MMVKINGSGTAVKVSSITDGTGNRLNITLSSMELAQVVSTFGSVNTMVAEGLDGIATYNATRGKAAEIVTIYRAEGGSSISVVLLGIAKA